VVTESRVVPAVPVAAVRAGDAGTPVVLVVTSDGGDGAAEVPVTLGDISGGWVEVSGVEVGTQVVLP
jgi:multidrug efflux pump subunit AcrA (membrane-fusion protein)